MERLETQDRPGSRAARHASDGAVGAESEGLHGFAGLFPLPLVVRRGHPFAPQAGDGHLPHPAGRTVSDRHARLRFQGPVPGAARAARYDQLAGASGRRLQHRRARRGARTHRGAAQAARLLQLLGQQHPLSGRYAGRRPPGGADDDRRTACHRLRRARPGAQGQQHGLSHRPDQPLPRLRPRRGADRFDLRPAARYDLLPGAEHHLPQPAPSASQGAAPERAALSQLYLRFRAGQPHLQRSYGPRLFPQREDRVRRAAPAGRRDRRGLLRGRGCRYDAHVLYARGLSRA